MRLELFLCLGFRRAAKRSAVKVECYLLAWRLCIEDKRANGCREEEQGPEIYFLARWAE